ncbi:MAG: glycosyltransferase family 4 protein [Verrucomicrobia bacterium]|nr:glycosyltransferase family 4 protein [Verrucomicrobiota bacterium]
MKVLFLTNLYAPHHIGGYELIAGTVSAGLRRRDHETRVLTSTHRVPGRGEAEDESRVERSLRLHGMDGYPWLGIQAVREIELHNNRVLRATLAGFQPDLVHVFNPAGLSKSLLLTLQRLDLPTVYFVSDHWIVRNLAADVWLNWWNRDEAGAAHRLLRAAWTMLGRRRAWDTLAPTDPTSAIEFRRIYFCSRYLREEAVAKGHRVGHGEVIYNSADTVRFHGPPRRADQPLRRLLYVGRLHPDKGVLTLLEALAAARDRWPGELTLCGGGAADFEAQLRARVERDGLPVHFRRAGADEMPEVYRSHDALAFTSEWGEPFALTPLEAMASGLPVIGTTTGGSAEIFRDGENALTYPAGDAAALSACLLRLAGDDALRARLAADGQAEVAARFGEERMLAQVAAYLEASPAHWPARGRQKGGAA